MCGDGACYGCYGSYYADGDYDYECALTAVYEGCDFDEGDTDCFWCETGSGECGGYGWDDDSVYQCFGEYDWESGEYNYKCIDEGMDNDDEAHYWGGAVYDYGYGYVYDCETTSVTEDAWEYNCEGYYYAYGCYDDEYGYGYCGGYYCDSTYDSVSGEYDADCDYYGSYWSYYCDDADGDGYYNCTGYYCEGYYYGEDEYDYECWFGGYGYDGEYGFYAYYCEYDSDYDHDCVGHSFYGVCDYDYESYYCYGDMCSGTFSSYDFENNDMDCVYGAYGYDDEYGYFGFFWNEDDTEGYGYVCDYSLEYCNGYYVDVDMHFDDENGCWAV
jgi:hypothetical protein